MDIRAVTNRKLELATDFSDWAPKVHAILRDNRLQIRLPGGAVLTADDFRAVSYIEALRGLLTARMGREVSYEAVDDFVVVVDDVLRQAPVSGTLRIADDVWGTVFDSVARMGISGEADMLASLDAAPNALTLPSPKSRTVMANVTKVSVQMLCETMQAHPESFLQLPPHLRAEPDIAHAAFSNGDPATIWAAIPGRTKLHANLIHAALFRRPSLVAAMSDKARSRPEVIEILMQRNFPELIPVRALTRDTAGWAVKRDFTIWAKLSEKMRKEIAEDLMLPAPIASRAIAGESPLVYTDDDVSIYKAMPALIRAAWAFDDPKWVITLPVDVLMLVWDYLSPAMQNDYDVVAKIIAKQPSFYVRLSSEQKQNPDFAEAYVKSPDFDGNEVPAGVFELERQQWFALHDKWRLDPQYGLDFVLDTYQARNINDNEDYTALLALRRNDPEAYAQKVRDFRR